MLDFSHVISELPTTTTTRRPGSFGPCQMANLQAFDQVLTDLKEKAPQKCKDLSTEAKKSAGAITKKQFCDCFSQSVWEMEANRIYFNNALNQCYLGQAQLGQNGPSPDTLIIGGGAAICMFLNTHTFPTNLKLFCLI